MCVSLVWGDKGCTSRRGAGTVSPTQAGCATSARPTSLTTYQPRHPPVCPWGGDPRNIGTPLPFVDAGTGLGHGHRVARVRWWAALVLDRGWRGDLKCQAQQPARGQELRCWQRRAQPPMAAPTPTERRRDPDPTLILEAPRAVVGGDPVVTEPPHEVVVPGM